MNHRNNTPTNWTSLNVVLVVAIFVSLVVISSVSAQDFIETPGQQLAVPATFVRYVKTPGAIDHIARPTAVHWDRFNNEILVADFGNNRILVFAPSGSYKFEFGLGMEITAPSDIVTDPEGYIYVLGSSPKGHVLNKFDFDGLSLGPIPLPLEYDGINFEPKSVSCDSEGILYLLDNAARRVLIVDRETGLISSFGVGKKNPENKDFFGLGRIALSGNELLIPVSTEGTVLRYGLDGTTLGSVGHFGSKPGTLNFPVAVEVSPEGIVAVLDQSRFCVVCYGPDGRVLGEFGGKGTSPGWFINPTLLAIPSADHVVIGQIYENKIQVCALPEFVRGRNRHSAIETIVPLQEIPAEYAGFEKNNEPRYMSHSFNSQSSGSGDSHHPVPVSHLEVSE